MSTLVKLGKKGKQIAKKVLAGSEKHYVSYVRRIERVKTARRVCAMTFDDGPMDLPACPDRFDGRSMTDVLLDTLAQYGAKGTFDVVGFTGDNYPDEPGKPGSPAWGGVRYDHYPDFGKDVHGGALHCDRLIRRMLDEGHQITNHGYRHILFGRKSFVYGKRATLGSLDAVLEDLSALDTYLKDHYDYAMTLSRPPHYVDAIGDGFASYDAYARMDYQYMAASFDGAGWLPSTLEDENAALEAEIRAMTEPIRRALESDPDVFCGQIIFQKDGCNMARRTPVAFALGEQLRLLTEAGYEIVTVQALTEESPFADVGRDDPLFSRLCELAKTAAVAFDDNTLRLEKPMTAGELAMLLAPKAEALARQEALVRAGRKPHPYRAAMDLCADAGLMDRNTKPDAPVTALPDALFEKTEDFTRRGVYAAYRMQ